MSTLSHEPIGASERRPSVRRLVIREMWAGLAIVSMWIAVLIDAIVGPDIVTTSAAGDHVSVPSAVAVALFASLASWAVAKYGFGHRDT